MVLADGNKISLSIVFGSVGLSQLRASDELAGSGGNSWHP